MWIVICGEAQLAFLCLLVKTAWSLAQIEENHFREAELSNRQISTGPDQHLEFHSLCETVLKLSLGLNIAAPQSWPWEVAIKCTPHIFNKNFLQHRAKNYHNDLYYFVVVTMDSANWKSLAISSNVIEKKTIKQSHSRNRLVFLQNKSKPIQLLLKLTVHVLDLHGYHFLTQLSVVHDAHYLGFGFFF